MRLKLIYLAILVFVLSGCDTTKDQPKPEKELKYYLQKQVANYVWPTGGSGTIDQEYTYNDRNLLIGVVAISYTSNEPFRQTISYNEDDKVVHIQSTSRLSWSNLYNEKNQLIKQVRNTILDDESVNVHYYKNTYNNAGELVEAQIRNIKNGIDEPGPIYRYTYTDGQVSSILGEKPNGEKYIDHYYTYDNKRAPLPSYLPKQIGMRYTAFSLPGRFLSDRNVTSYTAIDEKGQRMKHYCFTATYTYNEAGYPIESTRNFEDGTVEKTTYTYIVR